MVLFGHQNWNLVLNMMMGISMAVKSVSNTYTQSDQITTEILVSNIISSFCQKELEESRDLLRCVDLEIMLLMYSSKFVYSII